MPASRQLRSLAGFHPLALAPKGETALSAVAPNTDHNCDKHFHRGYRESGGRVGRGRLGSHSPAPCVAGRASGVSYDALAQAPVLGSRVGASSPPPQGNGSAPSGEQRLTDLDVRVQTRGFQREARARDPDRGVGPTHML
ncbi:hypothetical protein P4O66_016602 [Electrophorus voltai]|uniref:Uncharacterized protein n=1 Tax=Electrophorus voltai TaxID=2609070 RepID=A0AAD8YW97_9TELE|nr:hypothetical protein P4O66_016602 [Electrophorus voltai]